MIMYVILALKNLENCVGNYLPEGEFMQNFWKLFIALYCNMENYFHR